MKTFRLGGIHPKPNKLSAGVPVRTLALPQQVSIPLAHYSGTPAEAVVQKGDVVKVGQLIGKAQGYISANVHASVSGRVSKVDVQLDASGYKRQAVFIDVEGDEWLDGIIRDNQLIKNCDLSKDQIIDRIQQAGIVGLGGATFPAHVKLMIPSGKKAEVLVVNGVECEPYLTCDHRLMLEHTQEVVVGIRILMKALDVKRAVIGIENDKQDAIASFKEATRTEIGVEVVALKTKYPQGSEKQLIDALLRKRVPSGKLPIDVGVVVQNVATVFAVYEAVQKNKPMIERILTITGEAVAQPGNYRVRIGTYLDELVGQVGGVPEGTGKIIGGGPMMGRSLMNLRVPTAKGSAGILFMPEEASYRSSVSNCIRCSHCVAVCPMGLEPFLLMAHTEKNNFDELKENRVMDCVECGACSYICPSHRPLLDYIRFGKATVASMLKESK